MEYKIKAEVDFLTYSSVDKLTRGIYNRYELVMAVAKAAREITDIQYIQSEEIKKNADEKDSHGLVITAAKGDIPYKRKKEMENNTDSKNFKRDKTYLKIDSVLTNENAVKTAIRRIYNGELIIVKTE